MEMSVRNLNLDTQISAAIPALKLQPAEELLCGGAAPQMVDTTGTMHTARDWREVKHRDRKQWLFNRKVHYWEHSSDYSEPSTLLLGQRRWQSEIFICIEYRGAKHEGTFFFFFSMPILKVCIIQNRRILGGGRMVFPDPAWLLTGQLGTIRKVFHIKFSDKFIKY